MPFNVGPLELIIVLAIALIVLGPEEAAGVRPLDRLRHARVQGLATTSSSTRDEDEESVRAKS